MATLTDEDLDCEEFREAWRRVREMRGKLAVPQGEEATFGAHARCWFAHVDAMARYVAYTNVWPLGFKVSPRAIQVLKIAACLGLGAVLFRSSEGPLDAETIGRYAACAILMPLLFWPLLFIAYVLPVYAVADFFGFVRRRLGGEKGGQVRARWSSRVIQSCATMTEMHRAKRAAGKGSDWKEEFQWDWDEKWEEVQGRASRASEAERWDEGNDPGEALTVDPSAISAERMELYRELLEAKRASPERPLGEILLERSGGGADAAGRCPALDDGLERWVGERENAPLLDPAQDPSPDLLLPSEEPGSLPEWYGDQDAEERRPAFPERS